MAYRFGKIDMVVFVPNFSARPNRWKSIYRLSFFELKTHIRHAPASPNLEMRRARERWIVLKILDFVRTPHAPGGGQGLTIVSRPGIDFPQGMRPAAAVLIPAGTPRFGSPNDKNGIRYREYKLGSSLKGVGKTDFWVGLG